MILYDNSDIVDINCDFIVNGYNVAQAVLCTNEKLKKIDFSNLNKTIFSSIVEQEFCSILSNTSKEFVKNKHEKGRPDLVSIKNKELFKCEFGLDVKVTTNRSFAAHHNKTKNLLGIFCDFNKIGIKAVIFIGNINQNDWSIKKNECETENTPCCNIKNIGNNGKYITIDYDFAKKIATMHKKDTFFRIFSNSKLTSNIKEKDNGKD